VPQKITTGRLTEQTHYDMAAEAKMGAKNWKRYYTVFGFQFAVIGKIFSD
jgi:hypothetical protein